MSVTKISTTYQVLLSEAAAARADSDFDSNVFHHIDVVTEVGLYDRTLTLVLQHSIDVDHLDVIKSILNNLGD